MSDPVFAAAYARVRARYSSDEWRALSGKEITEAIYREIRAIDAEGQPGPDGEAPKQDQGQ